MLRQEQFTTLANGTSTRYTSYLEAISAAYNRVILSKELNYSSISSFKKEMDMLNKHYLEKEVDNMVSNYETLKKMIEQDTSFLDINVLDDNEWADYLSENTNFTYEAIKLQSMKDSLYAKNFLRNKIIEVINMSDYEKAYNLLFSSRDLGFFYTDKLGRKVNAVKYVRTLTRDFFVKNYNDLVAGSAILNGVNEVTILNSDSNHGDHDKIISVNNQNTVNYFSIRTDAFHPNSNSIIKVQNVST